MSIRDPLTFSNPKRVDAATVSPNIKCGNCDHRALLHPSRDNTYKVCAHPSCKCIGFIVAGFLSQTASTRPEASAIPEPADPRAAALHGFCAAKGMVLYPKDQAALLAAIDKADPIRRIVDTDEPLQDFIGAVYTHANSYQGGLFEAPVTNTFARLVQDVGSLARALEREDWNSVRAMCEFVAAKAADLAIRGDSALAKSRLDAGLDTPTWKP